MYKYNIAHGKGKAETTANARKR